MYTNERDILSQHHKEIGYAVLFFKIHSDDIRWKLQMMIYKIFMTP